MELADGLRTRWPTMAYKVGEKELEPKPLFPWTLSKHRLLGLAFRPLRISRHNMVKQQRNESDTVQQIVSEP
jgi:hypothetical protein